MSPSRILAGALASVAALGILGTAAPAHSHEDDSRRTWSSDTTTVCVESHVSKQWNVKGALRRWNQLESGPTFVLKARCPAYEGTVTVRYDSGDNRYTGWSKWYWNESGDIVHADVTVNPHRIKAFAHRDRSCQRKHTITHEFGHVLGLRHYLNSHSGSVMSYLGWDRLCGDLSSHDVADHSDLYPVGVPVEATRSSATPA